MVRLIQQNKDILRLIAQRPRVVATLLGPSDLPAQAKKAKKDGADILEIRVDSFSQTQRKAIVPILSQIKKTAALPILITVRDPREQGAAKGGAKGLVRLGDSERLDLYQQTLPFADLLDVELNSRIAGKVCAAARKTGVKTVLSYHDFSGAPNDKRIAKLTAQFKKLKGDILKIAARPKDRLGILRFMLACLKPDSIPKAFIAMGDEGKISRLAGFCFGSCLTYGFIGRSAAPGQVPVKDLAMVYSKLKSEQNSAGSKPARQSTRRFKSQ